MSQAHLQFGDLQSLANDLKTNMKALNPLDWEQYINFIAVIGCLVLCVVLLFPCILRVLFRSVGAVQQEVYEFHLKNKKRGIAAPTAEATV